MMSSKEIAPLLHPNSFKRFRINMTSGKSYEIRHPEIAFLTRNYIVLFTPLVEDGLENELWAKLSLLLVESIETLESHTRTES